MSCGIDWGFAITMCFIIVGAIAVQYIAFKYGD